MASGEGVAEVEPARFAELGYDGFGLDDVLGPKGELWGYSPLLKLKGRRSVRQVEPWRGGSLARLIVSLLDAI
jgi:hypothetical protein